jgi:pyridoxine/pyridoxamine 5'-phosphate oxidase
MSPLLLLVQWVDEERAHGCAFANGAVLGTAGPAGEVRTRMLGVHFDAQGVPRFHTTPGSRKALDLASNPRGSLTFAFQNSRRSVSLQGWVEPLSPTALNADWALLEADFRRSYLVFGPVSGKPLDTVGDLDAARHALAFDAEHAVPPSFVGFKFAFIDRVAFYAVGPEAFAQHTLYSRGSQSDDWAVQAVVP